MNKIIDNSILIHLNSKYGYKTNGGMNSDVLFNTGVILSDDESILYSEVQLVNVSFPLVFYNINDNNNKLDLSINGTNSTIFIPNGNYDITQFVNYVRNNYGTLIFISYNQITSKISFGSINNYTVILYATSTIKSVLGFSIDTTLIGIQELPYPVNLSGNQIIKVSSELINCDNYDIGGNNNLIDLVYVNNKYGRIQTYEFNSHKNMLKNKHIVSIDIKLTDENNNYLNFLNQEWNITLRIIKYTNILFSTKLSIYDMIMGYSKKQIQNDINDENLTNNL